MELREELAKTIYEGLGQNRHWDKLLTKHNYYLLADQLIDIIDRWCWLKDEDNNAYAGAFVVPVQYNEGIKLSICEATDVGWRPVKPVKGE
jgi:hypothetical protein